MAKRGRHCIALVFIILFVFLEHYSLLLGETLMKWDIYNAEYGLQMFISDSLRSGELPLWCPMIHYGTPFYAVLGMPIWYPVTLLLGLLGYGTVSVGIEYAFHLIIAGFGMYLLSDYIVNTNGKRGGVGYCVSVCMGLIYCSSGLFLSNASHIMIIISAALSPYVLYFLLRCARENRISLLLPAGLFLGNIAVAGYPELLYNLCIFLIPYSIVIFYKTERKWYQNILTAFKKYTLLGIFSVWAGMIILLPAGMTMPLITRTASAQVPSSFPPITFLSILIPGIETVLSTLEPTMINFYMGFITLLVIPVICKSKNKYSFFALLASIICLFLSFPEISFGFQMLYRFLPAYNMMRFPTVWRSISMMLILIAAVVPLTEGIREKRLAGMRTNALILSGVLCSIAIAFGLLEFILKESDSMTVHKWQSLSKGAFLSGLCMLLYAFLFGRVNENSTKVSAILLVALVCFETLSVCYIETPITITRYKQNSYVYDGGVRAEVDWQKYYTETRNRSVDFSNSIRTRSGLYNTDIVCNNQLDEEGYCSFALASTEAYKTTYNRFLNSLLPELYFTSRAVDSNQVDYAQWVNDITVSPWQIYVESSEINNGYENETAEYAYKPETLHAIVMSNTGNRYEAQYSIPGSSHENFGLRLYIDTDNSETHVVFSIRKNASEIQKMEGTFPLRTGEDGRKYFDFVLPMQCMTGSYELMGIELLSDGSILEADIGVLNKLEQSEAQITVNEFSLNTIRFEIDVQKEGYAVLLQAWHKNWRLKVDGIEMPIEKINKAFMGTYLTPGMHTIEFSFVPMDFYIAAVISISYWLFMIAVLIFEQIILRNEAKRKDICVYQ